jgi:hypothetical protein
MVTVPMAPSVALLRFHEPLDLGLGEVLPPPQLGVGRPHPVICITLSSDREVHRKAGWASANSTPAEALCGRSCLGRQQLWACPGHNPMTIPGLPRRPQIDRDRLRTQPLRQLGDVGGDAPGSSRVKMLIDDQGGGDHTHCILLRRWYESRRLVTRVTFLALAAIHSSSTAGRLRSPVPVR